MGDIINGGQIVNIISASTTSYMAQFSSIFVFIGGILLAVIVMAVIVEVVMPNRGPIVTDSSIDHGPW